MCEITIQVKCSHCNITEVKKNGKKPIRKQNFLCLNCHKQLQYAYHYHGANAATKALVHFMVLNDSGIRDISRLLNISIGCIISTLRSWFKQNKEPCFTGSYQQV